MLIYILYNLLMIVLAPFLALGFWATTIWSPKFRGTLARRWGLRLPPAPMPGQESVWIHSVSVGEATGAAGVIRNLQRLHPDLKIYLSATTKTGREIAEKMLKDSVTYLFFPIDHPFTIKRVLNRLRPRAIGIMETELWPNLIVLGQRRGIPVLMLNGRVSDRMASARGAVVSLYRYLFRHLSFMGMQTREDARRLAALGAEESSVQVVGNAKLDFILNLKVDPEVKGIMERFRGHDGRLFVAASTHPGEEEQVIDAFVHASESVPGLKFLLAPRHVERAGEVASILKSSGLDFVRRSTREMPGPDVKVFLLDTIGELVSAFAAADAAFVGGSLIDRGGHNVLEPASMGVPTFYGPHTQNFVESVRILEDGGAGGLARDSSELARVLTAVLGRSDIDIYREKIRELVRAKAGAAEEYARRLSALAGF